MKNKFLVLLSIIFYAVSLSASINLNLPEDYYLDKKSTIYFSKNNIYLNAKKDRTSIDFFILDKKTLRIKKLVKNHEIIGVYGNRIITLSHIENSSLVELKILNIKDLKKINSTKIEVKKQKLTDTSVATILWKNNLLIHANQTVYDVRTLEPLHKIRNKSNFHAIYETAYSSYGRSFYKFNLDTFDLETKPILESTACKSLATYKDKIYTFKKMDDGKNIVQERDSLTYKVLKSVEVKHKVRASQLSITKNHIAVISIGRNNIIDIYNRQSFKLEKVIKVKNLVNYGFYDKDAFIYTTVIKDLYNKADLIRLN